MATCIRCKREIEPSNLIAGTTCFECHERGLNLAEKMVKAMEFFSVAYKFAVPIAASLGLLYLIWDPTQYFGLILLVIIDGLLMVVALFGMLPHVFPAFSNVALEEMRLKFKDQYAKYTPGVVAYCIYHSDRPAVARCANCFEPFCAEDMSYLFGRPNTCHSCGQIYYGEMHVWESLNGIISVGLVSGVGIYLELTNFSGFGLSFVFIIFLVIIIAMVGIFQWMRKSIESQAGRKVFE